MHNGLNVCFYCGLSYIVLYVRQAVYAFVLVFICFKTKPRNVQSKLLWAVPR